MSVNDLNVEEILKAESAESAESAKSAKSTKSTKSAKSTKSNKVKERLLKKKMDNDESVYIIQNFDICKTRIIHIFYYPKKALYQLDNSDSFLEDEIFLSYEDARNFLIAKCEDILKRAKRGMI